MSRTVALIDWDGTVREGFTVRSWMHWLQGAGLVRDALVLELEHQFSLHAAGLISHDELADSAGRVYAESMNGVAVDLVRPIAAAFVDADRNNLFPCSLLLLAELVKRRIEPIVISGAPCEVMVEYQRAYHIAQAYCLSLGTRQGNFIAEVVHNPGVSYAKRRIVAELSRSDQLRVILAMGNSDSDRPLFAAASISVLVGDSIVDATGRSVRLKGIDDVLTVISMLDGG